MFPAWLKTMMWQGMANFATGHFLCVVLALGHCSNLLLGKTLHKHGNLTVDTAPIKIIFSG